MVHLSIGGVLDGIEYGIVKWNKKIIQNKKIIHSYFYGKNEKRVDLCVHCMEKYLEKCKRYS